MICNIIVIFCGIMLDEVVDVCGVLIEVGIMKIEVFLNLFDLFDSIECMCIVYGKDVLIGVGIVLMVEDVINV